MTSITLSRMDGKADVVPVRFPTLPNRFRVHEAYRLAMGYRGDEDQPSGEFDSGDALGVMWACIGLCWAGHDIDLPDFRDLRRDVVAYGEQVTTALWNAGYGDGDQQRDAGKELYAAFMADITDAMKRASADFPKAPRQEKKSAAQ